MPSLFEGFIPYPFKFATGSILQNPQNLHAAPPATEDLLALQEQLNLIKGTITKRLEKASKDLKTFQHKLSAATKERERVKESNDRAREKLIKGRIKREASGSCMTISEHKSTVS